MELDPKTNKLIIEIPTEEGKPKDEQPPELLLGMLPNRLYPRRTFRRPEDEEETLVGIYMDVFDLARLADGSDAGFRYDATIDVNPTNGNVNFSNTNYTAAYNAFYNPGGAAGWASSYYRVQAEDVAKYGAALGAFGGDYIPGRGFNTGGGLPGIGNNVAFHYFNTGLGAAGTDYTKFTDSPGFGSAEVTPVIDRDAEIYLAPRVWFNHGSSVQSEYTPFGLEFREWTTNYFYEALPRSFFLDNAAWATFKPSVMFSSCLNNFYPGINSATPSDGYPGRPPGGYTPVTPDAPAVFKTSWRAFQLGRPGARGWYVRRRNGFLMESNTVSPGAMPTYDLATRQLYFNDFGLPHYIYGDTQQEGYNQDPGLFLAAIRVKADATNPEKWYYVYRKHATVLWSLDCSGASGIGGGSFTGQRYDIRV